MASVSYNLVRLIRMFCDLRGYILVSRHKAFKKQLPSRKLKCSNHNSMEEGQSNTLLM